MILSLITNNLNLIAMSKQNGIDRIMIDFLFWDSVFNYFGKKCAIINIPISHYNKLSQKK